MPCWLPFKHPGAGLRAVAKTFISRSCIWSTRRPPCRFEGSQCRCEALRDTVGCRCGDGGSLPPLRADSAVFDSLWRGSVGVPFAIAQLDGTMWRLSRFSECWSQIHKRSTNTCDPNTTRSGRIWIFESDSRLKHPRMIFLAIYI